MKIFLFLLTGCGMLSLAALDLVIPGNAHFYEKHAAEELKQVLRQGGYKGTLRIVKAEKISQTAIYFGQKFANWQLPENAESWSLRNRGKSLVIAGKNPIGTLYGCYALLRKMGVWFIAWDETVIPDLSNFRIPQLSLDGAPAFSGRQLFNRYPNFFRDNRAVGSSEKFWLYYLRNLFNGTTPAFNKKVLYVGEEMRWTDKAHFAHNYYTYLPPDKYFKSHPEYFSMNKSGKREANPHRRGTQLCLSNPAVARIVAGTMLDFIRRDRQELPPEKQPVVYNLTPNDASNVICWCPDCRKIVKEEGCETGLLIRFTNDVLTRVRKEYPEIRIYTRGAMGNQKLPKTKPLPGVSVYYADDFVDTSCFHPIGDKRKKEILRWTKNFDRALLWDYWNMGLGAYFSPPRPEVVLDAVISDVRWMHKNGICTLFVEAERDFMIPQNFLDLEYFVLAQLMIDPQMDAETLIGIFCKGYYGKGSPYVREYLAALREGVKKQKCLQTASAAVRWEFLTKEFMLKNYQLLQKALQAAEDEPVKRVRIEAECLPLYWSILFYRNETAALFARAGISLEQITKDLRRFAGNVLASFKFSPRHTEKLQKRLNNKLAMLDANLTVPEKFAGISGCKVYAWPHIKRVAHSKARAVADADALTGKAVLSDFHKSRKFSHPSTRVFSCYDYTSRKNVSFQAAPSDEAYHWYKIPDVRVSENSIFTAHLWMIQLQLVQAWEFPHRGDLRVNDYDVHFRAKFTGPAYVKGSQKKNAIYLDCVVLVPKLKR